MSASFVPNLIGGEFVELRSSRSRPLTDPSSGEILGRVPFSTRVELENVVRSASAAQKSWSDRPIRDRIEVLFRLRSLVEQHSQGLSAVIRKESGKTEQEAHAEVLGALESVDFALGLAERSAGVVQEIAKGIECKALRFPLGLVAGITPFSSALMVPMWMIPIAIGLGNAFLLKPSELTPLSAIELAKLLKQAGLPSGIFSILHGDRELVDAICDHPGISAIGFVGTSANARAVYERASASAKRVRAIGGSKNHVIVLPDAEPELAARGVVNSVLHASGQSCLACSVLLAVGEVDAVINLIRMRMENLVPGNEISALISREALQRVEGYIARAEEGGAELLLDGRLALSQGSAGGNFIGASIIDFADPQHESSVDEIFGPLLTIVRCDSLDEALQIQNRHPCGNAATIYTSSAESARYFATHVAAGMVGVNVESLAARAPFAFGGWNDSCFGDGNLTGVEAIDFWSRTKKITSQWVHS